MTMEARAGLKGSDRWLKSERLELAQLSFGEGQRSQRVAASHPSQALLIRQSITPIVAMSAAKHYKLSAS